MGEKAKEGREEDEEDEEEDEEIVETGHLQGRRGTAMSGGAGAEARVCSRS